jgi:hypothetical protein
MWGKSVKMGEILGESWRLARLGRLGLTGKAGDGGDGVWDIKGVRERRMSSAGGSGKSAYELAVHEEKMDSIMKGVCDKSRWALWTELDRIRREYTRHVVTLKGLRDSEGVMEGDILIGIAQLSDHWRQNGGTFQRKEDTYHCCLTLHLCTKLLATLIVYKWLLKLFNSILVIG